jgi:hypothetical protein
MELKRRNDKDITNQWQNRKYFIFYLHPSKGPRPRDDMRRRRNI